MPKKLTVTARAVRAAHSLRLTPDDQLWDGFIVGFKRGFRASRRALGTEYRAACGAAKKAA